MFARELVAGLASTCQIGLFATGIFVCRKIVKNGHTHESSFFPLMMMFVNSSLWFKYGLLTENTALLAVNGIGAVLSFGYVAIYYMHTSHRRALQGQLLLGFALLIPCLVYVKFYATNHDDALLYLGYTCVALGVLGYASPLSAMVHVIRHKSTACMSLSMSVGNCVVSLEWLVYGSLLEDSFIQRFEITSIFSLVPAGIHIPSFIGMLLGLVQLALFLKYPHQSGQKHTSTTNLATDVRRAETQ